MVGHTGNMEAAKKAVEAMDKCIADVISATENISGSLIITADHGNAELMLDVENKQVHTTYDQPSSIHCHGQAAKKFLVVVAYLTSLQQYLP